MPTIAITATADHASDAEDLGQAVELPLQRGTCDRFVAVTMSAMRPICVDWPVAVTMNAAEPRVTWVFWNTMSVRSPSATSLSGDRVVALGTGALSPVSAASWTSSVADGDEPPVGGHQVARLEQHDVAGHELARVDLLTLADRRTRARGTWS